MVPKDGATGVASDLLGKKGKETQLGKEVSWQIEEILNFYRVEITLPGPAEKLRKWTLILEGFDKSTSRKLELHYPTLLGPCR